MIVGLTTVYFFRISPQSAGLYIITMKKLFVGAILHQQISELVDCISVWNMVDRFDMTEI